MNTILTINKNDTLFSTKEFSAPFAHTLRQALGQSVTNTQLHNIVYNLTKRMREMEIEDIEIKGFYLSKDLLTFQFVLDKHILKGSARYVQITLEFATDKYREVLP